VLTTVSTTAADEQLPGAARALQQGLAGGDTWAVARAGEALAEGYTTGFLAGAGLLLAAVILVAATVATRGTQRTAETADAVRAAA
jgi:hypothetical protein